MYQTEDRESGFSLTEIIVTIVIMGILTGIAVGATIHQRNKGRDLMVENDIRTMQAAIQQYWVGAQKTMPVSGPFDGNNLPVNSEGQPLMVPEAEQKIANYQYIPRNKSGKAGYCLHVMKRWSGEKILYNSVTDKFGDSCGAS